jgi:type VI secretion system protein ImpA
MAEDLAALTRPISEGEPCGPDLDLAGDVDYMNFVAKAESLIPTSFFSGPEETPFDRSKIDFAAELGALRPLLARTRDVRLLTILAKFSILNRDIGGFETAVFGIQELLKERWDEVHPRGEDGAFGARMAAIETLNDMAPVIFPLQYATLVRHRRLGEIRYRDYMIAAGEAKAREGESSHDMTAIETALMEAELPELAQVLGRFDALGTALGDIRQVFGDRAGLDQAPGIERLLTLVDKIRSLLNNVVVKRDPSLARAAGPQGDGDDAAAGPTITGEVGSVADAANALAAVAEYFSRCEPSNPALLLVRQAEQLMGKSFFEVMQILVPTHVEKAAINVGKEQVLQLPLQRLSGLVSSSASSSSLDGNSGSSSRHLEAKTRADAFRLLEQIGAFYRGAEPTSPLPYLTDRARELASRDFVSLLKQVLPEAALKSSSEE